MANRRRKSKRNSVIGVFAGLAKQSPVKQWALLFAFPAAWAILGLIPEGTSIDRFVTIAQIAVWSCFLVGVTKFHYQAVHFYLENVIPHSRFISLAITVAAVALVEIHYVNAIASLLTEIHESEVAL